MPLHASQSLGALTVGTGNSTSPIESFGDLNLSHYRTDAYQDGDTGALLKAAFDRSRRVLLLPGVYPPPLSHVVLGDEHELLGCPGSILKPKASGAIGLFDVQGSECVLGGFRVWSPTTPVANQAWVKITGDSCKLDGTRFHLDAAGDTANPTIAVLVGDGVNALIGPQAKGIRVYPHKGLTVWKSALSRSFSWDANCYVGPRKQSDGVRLCWRVFELLDDERWNVSASHFNLLGSEADSLDFFLRASASSGNDEGGHFGFCGNMVETVTAAIVFDLRAQRYARMTENRFGRLLKTAAVVLKISGVDGNGDPATAGNSASINLDVSRNEWHNVNRALELGFCRGIDFEDNHVSICAGPMITNSTAGTGAFANTCSASRVSIRRNKFFATLSDGAGGGSPVALARVMTLLTGAGKINDGLWIEDNVSYNTPVGVPNGQPVTWTALVNAIPSAVAGASGRVRDNYRGTSGTPGTLDVWGAGDW